MRKLFALPLLLVILLSGCKKKEIPSFNVMSFNLRYDTPNDSINAWPNRKDAVADLVKFHEAEIVGVQEALLHQLKDLEERLPDHKWLGVGRDDGIAKGEFSAILYNKHLFQVMDSGTFWLSDTPDVPSKGWDAAIVRVCSWAKMKNRHLGKDFYIFNTHYDHIGVEARTNSSKLIIEKVKEIAGNLPVILTGDFNSEPETKAYETLTEGLTDARNLSENPPYGPYGTWNGFDHNADLTRRIDYIFVNEKVLVRKYAVLSDAIEKRYPSDHLPVMAEVMFR
jgi:endonuclease/exonuclease/phosphatase family metal-dependent hydrolase